MTVTLTLSLDDAVVARLDALAQDTDRPRDRLVREALESFVRFEEAQIAKVKEGMAAADRGEFVTEDALDEIERELQAKIDARS